MAHESSRSPGFRSGAQSRSFPRRFYTFQAILLALSAVALLVVFHAWPIDQRLAEPFYDSTTHTFPWRYAWVSKYLVHRYVKYVLLTIGVLVLAVAVLIRVRPPTSGFLRSHEKRWSFVAWCFVLVPSVIGILRRLSPMHCPWEIDSFGGYAPYFDLLTWPPQGVRAGHCFPAAFVASSSWMLALPLLWFPERRRLGFTVGTAALLVTLALGWVQQMRGAHFLSHTLWSVWVSWAVILATHFSVGAWREPAKDKTGPAATVAAHHGTVSRINAETDIACTAANIEGPAGTKPLATDSAQHDGIGDLDALRW